MSTSESWRRSLAIQRASRQPGRWESFSVKLARLEQAVKAAGPDPFWRQSLRPELAAIVDAAYELVGADPNACPAPNREWACKLRKGHEGACEDA